MEQPHYDNPLLLPDILHLVLPYLERKDLLNAILVNSTWAKAAYGYKWQTPCNEAVMSLPKDKVQRYCTMVRCLRFTKLLDLQRLSSLQFANLRRCTVRWPLGDSVPVVPFLTPTLTHLSLDLKYHPQRLFEVLRAQCCDLSHLYLAFQAPPYEDLIHLAPLLQQCDKLIDLSIAIIPITEHGDRLAMKVMNVIAAAKLQRLVLKCRLPHGFSRSTLKSTASPFKQLQYLCLDCFDTADIAMLIPACRALRELDLSPTSGSFGELVPGLLACSSLTRLMLDLNYVSRTISLGDFMALKGMVSLKVLSLRSLSRLDVMPPLSSWHMIDIATSLTEPTTFICYLDGLIFSSKQFVVLGAAMPQIQYIDAAWIIDIDDLTSNALPEFNAVEMPYIHALDTKFPDVLFPELELLNIFGLPAPANAPLNSSHYTREGLQESEWSDGLKKFGKIAAQKILYHMPKLKYFDFDTWELYRSVEDDTDDFFDNFNRWNHCLTTHVRQQAPFYDPSACYDPEAPWWIERGQ